MESQKERARDALDREQATRLYSPEALRRLTRLASPPTPIPVKAVTREKTKVERIPVAKGSLPLTELIDPKGPIRSDEPTPAYARRRFLKPPLSPHMSRTGALLGVTLLAAGFSIWSVAGADDAVRAPESMVVNSSVIPNSPAGPTVGAVFQPAATARDERDRGRPTPLSERAAVDVLISGRDEQALDLYRELAGQRLDQPAYSAIVKILKRRIALRCKEQSPLGDKPCDSSL